MKSSVLRRINPLVKSYAEGRGNHADQKFPSYTDRNIMAYNNAVGAVIGNNAIVYGRQGFSYCFASLLKDSKGMYDKVDAIVIQVPPCPVDLSEDAYYHFIEWVLNYSPWRKVFVTKSINRVKKQGVVIIDPSFPANTVAAGAVALRMAWENYYWSGTYKKIDLWWDIAKKVSPKITFAITDCILERHKDTGQIKLAGGNRGHSPFRYSLDKDYYEGNEATSLDNYVLEKVYDRTSPWATSKTYSTLNIWKGGKRKKVLFQDHVQELLLGIGKKKNNNPFGAAQDSQSRLFNRDEVVDCLINEMDNIEKVMYAK